TQTQSHSSIAQQARRECERMEKITNQRVFASSNQNTQTQSQRSIAQQARINCERANNSNNQRVISLSNQNIQTQRSIAQQVRRKHKRIENITN
ncbi:23576_t:CDS:1, partial [Dentiscutata erythropus]